MRAWRVHELGDPADVLRLDDVKEPAPGPGDVAVEIAACGLNFADLLLCRGQYQQRPALPFTPGLETSGRIVEVGPSDEVITHPKHPYTRSLVSVIPVPEAGAAAEQILLQGETPSARAIPAGCRFHPRCWRFEALGRPEPCLIDDPALRAETHGVACHFALDEVIDQEGARR